MLEELLDCYPTTKLDVDDFVCMIHSIVRANTFGDDGDDWNEAEFANKYRQYQLCCTRSCDDDDADVFDDFNDTLARGLNIAKHVALAPNVKQTQIIWENLLQPAARIATATQFLPLGRALLVNWMLLPGNDGLRLTTIEPNW